MPPKRTEATPGLTRPLIEVCPRLLGNEECPHFARVARDYFCQHSFGVAAKLPVTVRWLALFRTKLAQRVSCTCPPWGVAVNV